MSHDNTQMVHINSNHPIKLKINSEYLITGNFCHIIFVSVILLSHKKVHAMKKKVASLLVTEH